MLPAMNPAYQSGLKLSSQGRHGEAIAQFEQALALEPDDEHLTIEIDLALAGIGFRQRQYSAAVATAERALADADRRGFDDLACEAMYMLGRHHLFVTFELGTAKRYFNESVSLAQRSGRRLWQVRILHLMVYLEFGRSATPARIEQARMLADELGSLEVATELDHVLAIAYLVEHRLDAASESAERALAAAHRYRLAETAAVVAGVRATIEAARGHSAEAVAQVDEAAAQLEPLGRALVSGTALVLAALVDDDLLEAARRVAETRALLPGDHMLFVPPWLGMFHGLSSVVVAAAGADVLVEGRDWVRLVAAFPHASFCIAQAIVAGRAGDAERASALFAEGDEALGGAPWLRALYRRYAGECAVNDGWGEPAGWLAEAEVYLENRGNEPIARACRSLLRLAGTSPRRQRTGPAETRYPGLELTTREADVLALLAEGLTNKEIAGRLYLSPRTVEKHVERILAKTNQPNRTALAAYATEHSPLASTT